MTRTQKAILLAALHLLLVCSLGGKLLYDRATRPRLWLKTAPVDPSLPIRGRYVSLRVDLPAKPDNHDGASSQPFVVPYFIPEHVPDPSQRQPEEELWVEVTLPRQGPPRPIRLAVKAKGILRPLNF